MAEERMLKGLLSLLGVTLVTGCSNLGQINGVPVNQDVSNLDAAQMTYCERQPIVCILGAAVVVGVIASGSDDTSEGPDNALEFDPTEVIM